MKKLIEDIKAHAMQHYDDGRLWDYIIECDTDEALEEKIKLSKARSVNGFAKWYVDYMQAHCDHRDDIQAEAF